MVDFRSVGDNPTYDRAKGFSRLSPTTSRNSPATIGTVATSSLNDGQLLVGAREIEIAAWARNAEKNYRGMNQRKQREYWNSLDENQQAILSSQGVSAPGGFLKSTLKYLDNPVTGAANLVLGAFGKWDRAVQRYSRTNLRVREDQGVFQVDPEKGAPGVQSWGNLGRPDMPDDTAVPEFLGIALGADAALAAWLPATLNWGKWKRYWDETEIGEETFWASTIQDARDSGVTGSNLEFAKAVAAHVKAPDNRDEYDKTELVLNAVMAELVEEVSLGNMTQDEAASFKTNFEELVATSETITDQIINLSKNKISTGRAVALSAGLTPGSHAFNQTSGWADAIQAFLDPTLVIGKGVKAVRAARWGIRGADDVVTKSLSAVASREISTTGGTVSDLVVAAKAKIADLGAETALRPAVKRQFDQIIDALNDEVLYRIALKNGATVRETSQNLGGVAKLLNEQPKFGAVLKAFSDEVVKFSDDAASKFIKRGDDGLWEATGVKVDHGDILEFFASKAGFSAIIDGRMAGHLRHVPIMPHLSMHHMPFMKMKNAMKASIDWLDDAPLRVLDKMKDSGKFTDDEWAEMMSKGGVKWGIKEMKTAAEGGQAIAGILTAAGVTIGRLGKYASRQKPGGVINLADSTSVVTFQRLTALLPSRIADELTNLYASTGNIAERQQIVRSVYDEIFTRLGVKEIGEGGEGAEWVARFLDDAIGSSKKTGTSQMYGLDGVDRVRLPNGEMSGPGAVITQQTSTQLALPNMAVLWAYSKRSSFWYRATGSKAFNHSFFDFAIGSVWAPAMLLRAGFPLRAAGDELLQAMMREGTIPLIRQRLGASARSSKPVFDPVWRVGRGIDSMLGRMDWYKDSKAALLASGDPHKLYAARKAAQAVRFLTDEVAPLGTRSVRHVQAKLAGQDVMDAAEKYSRMTDGSAVSREISDIYAAERGSTLHRQQEHLTELERADQAGRVPNDEHWLLQEYQTGGWDEFHPSDDAFYEHFISNAEQLMRGDDSMEAVRLLSDAVDEARSRVATSGGDIADWAREFNKILPIYQKEWAKIVAANPRLKNHIFETLGHAKYAGNGTVHIGAGTFDEIVGVPQLGFYVSNGPIIGDGASMAIEGAQRGVKGFGDGPIIRLNAKADDVLEDVRNLGGEASEKQVIGVATEGDLKLFDVEASIVAPSQFDSVRGAIDDILTDPTSDLARKIKTYDDLGDDVADSMEDLLRAERDFDSLSRSDDYEALGRSVSDFYSDMNLEKLSEVAAKARLVVDEVQVHIDELTRLGRIDEVEDLTELQLDFVSKIEEFDGTARFLTEFRGRLAAAGEGPDPSALLRFASPEVLSGSKLAPLTESYGNYAKYLEDGRNPLADASAVFDNPTAALLDGTYLDELNDGLAAGLRNSGIDGVSWKTSDGKEYASIFDSSRVQPQFTKTGEDLRIAKERGASEEDALAHLAERQFALVMQRLFTKSESGVSVPIPGMMSRLLDDGSSLGVDELRAMHTSGEVTENLHLREKLIEEWEAFGIEGMDFSRAALALPRTMGPEVNKVASARALMHLAFQKPFEAIGRVIDYISREPMFHHNLAVGAERAKAMWTFRPKERALLDGVRNLNGVGSSLPDKALGSAAKKVSARRSVDEVVDSSVDNAPMKEAVATASEQYRAAKANLEAVQARNAEAIEEAKKLLKFQESSASDSLRATNALIENQDALFKSRMADDTLSATEKASIKADYTMFRREQARNLDQAKKVPESARDTYRNAQTTARQLENDAARLVDEAGSARSGSLQTLANNSKAPLASVNTKTGVISINRARVEADYDKGLAYLRGMESGNIGSVQKAEVLARQGIHPDELLQWFDANGGARAYEDFILAHERAHLELGHKGTGSHEFLESHSLVKEMEANEVAFRAMEMPFGGKVKGLEFQDGKHIQEYVEILRARQARLDKADFYAKDPDLLLSEDDIGRALLDFAKQAEASGVVPRRMGENSLDYLDRVGKRLFEAEQEVYMVGVQSAINNTMAHIDSEPVVSYLAGVGRNMVPFWWAEERFLKRLTQTLYHSPEALFKAEMTYSGLKHMGSIQTDERGVDYFMYPGVNMSHHITAAMLGWVTGEDYAVPVVEGIKGRVIMSLPGLDQMGRPQVGPTVALPLKWVTNRFPELSSVTRPVIGDYAAGEAVSSWDLMFPSILTRSWKAMGKDNAVEHYASAHLQAEQVLVAQGWDIETLEDGSTRPKDPEEFMAQAERLTHVIAAMRVLYGFGGITPPEVSFPGRNEARETLFDLTATLGFAEGILEWQKKFPEESAYQVFQTETSGGASIPATEETLAYIADNQDFLTEHKNAAGYLIPRPLGETKFSQRAWEKQSELGLRRLRDDDEFYEAIKFAQAAPVYFESQDAYYAAREKVKGTRSAVRLDAAWRSWKESYFNLNPTFQKELNSNDRVQRRNDIIKDLESAFASDSLPENQTTERMRVFFEGFQAFTEAKKQIIGQTKQEKEKKERMKQRFLVWSQSNVEAYPELESFYLRVVLPEIRSDQDEAAAVYAAYTS